MRKESKEARGGLRFNVRRQFMAETAAALDGLERGGMETAAFDAELGYFVSQVVGEALRLGMSLVGRSAVRWLENRSAEELGEIVDYAWETARWVQPPTFLTRFSPSGDWDDLASFVYTLERAKSALKGVFRACVAKSLAPVSIENFDAFFRTIEANEKRLVEDVGAKQYARLRGNHRYHRP